MKQDSVETHIDYWGRLFTWLQAEFDTPDYKSGDKITIETKGDDQ